MDFIKNKIQNSCICSKLEVFYALKYNFLHQPSVEYLINSVLEIKVTRYQSFLMTFLVTKLP